MTKSRIDKVNLDEERMITQKKIHQLDPYIIALKEAFQLREDKRLTRMKMLALTTYLPLRTLETLAIKIESFVRSGGCVDMLDPHLEVHDNNARLALRDFFSGLHQLSEKLRSMAICTNRHEVIEAPVSDYSINQLYGDLMVCHSLTTAHPLLAEKVRGRIHRLLGKFTAPIFEISNRGVSGSSIWACAAAVIWSKENPKVPYRPAIVIGVLAPQDQEEEWHEVLTSVNELRLPENLRAQLQDEKKRAESIIQQGGMSFFLVEYLGSHEFSWVQEDNILEEFDPRNDPNPTSTNISGTIWFLNALNLTSYQKSVEDAEQALEEFNIQMTDPCGDNYTLDKINGNHVDPFFPDKVHQ